MEPAEAARRSLSVVSPIGSGWAFSDRILCTWVIILPAAAPSSPYRRLSLATPGRSRASGLPSFCLFLFACGRADVLAAVCNLYVCAKVAAAAMRANRRESHLRALRNDGEAEQACLFHRTFWQ